MTRASGFDRILLLLDVGAAASGARNMALDEALMELGRGGATVLRLYAWDPPCVSLGRNQRTPARPGGRPRPEWRPGREVVRRPTGGRSVYHGPELTYAFACPDRAWGGPREVYRRVNRAIGRGLASLGVALDPGARAPGGAGGREARDAPIRLPEPAAPPRRAAPGAHRALGPDACFRDPAPGELTVGGRKLVGSAQWRHRGAILQHGSILIRNEQARGALAGGAPADRAVPSRRVPATGAAPRTDDGRAAAEAAVGLADLLPVAPGRERLAAAVAAGLGEEWGCDPVEGGWPAAVLAAAAELEGKYGGAVWTWRR